MAKAKTPPPRSALAARPPPPSQNIETLPDSPNMNDSLSAAVAAAKKKKKKGKGKKADDELANGNLLPQQMTNTPFSATAQAQADLLATASDLYRRIEADPQGIPDDDAYWTSLPSHLRTFIRNALPIGQLPPSARNDSDDPNSRHASTQAMIAVAQQLAQAAHASQRHLQQHPPSGGNANFQNANNVPYPPFPFDPSVFADIALQTEQILPLHSHPNGADYRYNHANPPPTNPPGEPLPAPVVLVNEFEDEQGEFDEDYYSEDEMDPQEAATLDSRDGTWSNEMNGTHQNGSVAKTQSAATKKKNKKKKKKGGTDVVAVNPATTPATAPLSAPLPPPPPSSNLPRTTAPAATQTLPSNTASTPQMRAAAQSLPPSSRAAGKQPMTFNSAGSKAPLNSRPVNGHTHSHGPVSNAMGKRPASTATSSHEQGSTNGAGGHAWSSSSAEERERIKEFWLGLNERERKSLIKIEKDGVLKKMKEQQKHGCSCAVCGRKRSSIEDELEVLYDAYYDELEQYAHDQQRYVESGGQVPPPPGPGPFPGSVALDSQGAVIGGNALTKPQSKRQHHHTHPAPISRTKAALPPEDDEAYDEDLDDEEYDDDFDYEDEEDEEEELDEPEVKPSQRRRPETGLARTNTNAKASNDVFNFGSSLTVKGGILTVADDLLKNDGQKFLEMMEQLAERRALREEEVQAELDNASEEEELDEEEEEEDEEEVEEDALTDEQRMEEGRRMFQIFAARMFEQRVLQAYRERVAQERQLQLLRELEEEDHAEKEREAKKAKENQKKKDKKKQAKQQKEEERIRKEEEKAAEEAAAKAKIEKQREAELKKQDEIRLKREAEKRQKDEEKAKKEEERRKRQEEERNRELEKERKKREKEDKVRMERDAKEREIKVKEEDERRVKEQLIIERQQEQERVAREEQTRIEAERVLKEQQAKEAAARQVSPELPTAVAPSQTKNQTLPSGLPKSPSSSMQIGGASMPISRKVNVNMAPSSPAQHRSAGPLPSSSAPLQRGTAGLARPAMPMQSMASPSTLPAPPQGLPARPSTVSHTPSGSSSALAGGSSLPRPPIQSSNANPASIGSPARQGTPSNSAAPSVSQNKMTPPTLAAAPPLTPAGSSSFGKAGSIAQQATIQPHGRFPMMPFAGSNAGAGASTPTRSPPASLASNGYISSSNGKSAFDSVLGSPPSVNATTAGLASLNMGGPSQMPIGPIGAGISSANIAATAPIHSRNASMGNALDDYGRQLAGNSGSSRLMSRAAPGPIGPIGQRRELNLDEMAPGGMTSSSSIFGTNPLPERILGSSALGGDDELVEPQPRRTSHHTAPTSNSLFGTGAFGMTSPWASTFAGSGPTNGGSGSSTVPRTPSTATSSLLHGALGTGLTSPKVMTGSTAMGSIHQNQPSLTTGVDPWARASTGWDRARFAFEQPNGGQQQSSAPLPFQQQQQQSSQQQPIPPVGASPLSPFGTQSQHPLRGMFGVPGQSNPMSPHRHTSDRNGL